MSEQVGFGKDDEAGVQAPDAIVGGGPSPEYEGHDLPFGSERVVHHLVDHQWVIQLGDELLLVFRIKSRELSAGDLEDDVSGSDIGSA